VDLFKVCLLRFHLGHRELKLSTQHSVLGGTDATQYGCNTKTVEYPFLRLSQLFGIVRLFSAKVRYMSDNITFSDS